MTALARLNRACVWSSLRRDMIGLRVQTDDEGRRTNFVHVLFSRTFSIFFFLWRAGCSVGMQTSAGSETRAEILARKGEGASWTRSAPLARVRASVLAALAVMKRECPSRIM